MEVRSHGRSAVREQSAVSLLVQCVSHTCPCSVAQETGIQRKCFFRIKSGSPAGSDGKESACNAGDQGSIPGSGRPPGGGNGYPLQYSCLDNPMKTSEPDGLQSTQDKIRALKFKKDRPL